MNRFVRLVTRFIPDEIYLKIIFKKNTGYALNLKNPQTFNEKLQWLKLYNRNPEYTRLVDKYEVKKYIAQKIGEEYLIPSLGVWDSVEEIEWDKLPDQFVLKCTHDSGSIVVCDDKKTFDYDKAKQSLNHTIKINYYYAGREWPYKNVKPRIMAEKYMEDKTKEYLTDYKLMCFNGKVQCSFVVTERFSSDGIRVTFFDRDWNVMPFERHYPQSDTPIEKPQNYEKMIELAEKLGSDMPFVRVDFYEIDGKIFFGELTFSPGGGFEEFTPVIWDKKLGDWLELPNRKMKGKNNGKLFNHC